MLKKTLADIASYINAELNGEPNREISGIASLDSAQAGQISFLYNPSFAKHLDKTNASAVILSAEFAERCPVDKLIAKDPYACYAKLASLYQIKRKQTPGIHPTAIVAEGCKIDPSACISPYCVIGSGTIIGANVHIGAGCVIGANCMIAADSEIFPRVTCYDDVCIGERSVIHSGVVIGADGFGLVNEKGAWQQVPQLGGVKIGNDVLIGANTTIDRGALNNTVIGDGVKLDNLIQIAHNVQIGAHTVIAACTGIAGSTKIGEHCVIGGGVSIAGHLHIVDNVVLTGTTAVGHSINKSGVYSSGVLVDENRNWRRNAARFFNLDRYIKRLITLEKHVESRSQQSSRIHDE